MRWRLNVNNSEAEVNDLMSIELLTVLLTAGFKSILILIGLVMLYRIGRA